MKNYTRTCLSLDQETRGKIADLAERIGISKSETVKEAIKFLYNHVANWEPKENDL